MNHDWKTVRTGVRECRHCGAHSYLMMKRYPSLTEPSLSWSQVPECESFLTRWTRVIKQIRIRP